MIVTTGSMAEGRQAWYGAGAVAKSCFPPVWHLEKVTKDFQAEQAPDVVLRRWQMSQLACRV